MPYYTVYFFGPKVLVIFDVEEYDGGVDINPWTYLTVIQLLTWTWEHDTMHPHHQFILLKVSKYHAIFYVFKFWYKAFLYVEIKSE